MLKSTLKLIESNGWPRKYPYLVVRVFFGYYQREAIKVQVGPPFVEIQHGGCVIQHPAPLEADGSVSPACRELLTFVVQCAVYAMQFRMCVVWAKNSCTFVEADSTSESTQPPSGGAPQMHVEFGTQFYRPH